MLDGSTIEASAMEPVIIEDPAFAEDVARELTELLKLDMKTSAPFPASDGDASLRRWEEFLSDHSKKTLFPQLIARSARLAFLETTNSNVALLTTRATASCSVCGAPYDMCNTGPHQCERCGCKACNQCTAWQGILPTCENHGVCGEEQRLCRTCWHVCDEYQRQSRLQNPLQYDRDHERLSDGYVRWFAAGSSWSSLSLPSRAALNVIMYTAAETLGAGITAVAHHTTKAVLNMVALSRNIVAPEPRLIHNSPVSSALSQHAS